MSILELVKSYGRRLPKTAVSVVFTAMPMCIVFADGDDANQPKNWYLKEKFDDKEYSAATNMACWAEGSVGGAPGQPTASLSANGHYFVEGGRQLTTPNSPYEFPGLSLTLGSDSEDGSLCLRYDNQTFKNLILKRGSVIQYRSRSDTTEARYYNAIFGEATVESSKANPIVIKSRQKKLWMGWCGKLIGDENACMSVGSPDFAQVNLLVSITNAAAYHGEIVVTSKFANTGRLFGAGLGVGGSIPGTVRIKGGSMIKPHDHVAVAELDELHMDEGTEMRFVYDSVMMTGGQIRVKMALTLPEKIKVHALAIGVNSEKPWYPPISTTGEEIYSPFLVGPPGVRIDSEVFEFVPDPACEPQKNKDIRPQRIHFETKTDPETDRDTVYAVLEPIVWMKTKQAETLRQADALARGSALTNGMFWSDNREPHSNAHYVIDNGYLLSTCESDKEDVFGGKSLLFYIGTFGVFGGNHRLNIPDFQTSGNIRLGQSSSVTICGGRVRFCGAEPLMSAYMGKTLTIESEIVGDASLKLIGEASGSPQGFFAFTAYNTNWFGKIRVVAPSNASQDDWVKDYLTVRLYDGRNLGGKLEKFDYSALDLGRLCDLYAHTNVTLDAAVNRGVFLSHEKGARISVDAGYTLDCHWTITLNGPLYKTQPGTLALGGGIKFHEVVDNVTNITDTLPDDPSKRLLVVTNGTLKALTHDCVNGLTVALADDTSLALDFTEEECDLKKYGFYNVKTDTPFEAGRPINIQLNGVDGGKVKEWKAYKQGLITVRTSAADALKMDDLIRFGKPLASGGPNIRLIREDDQTTGFTTYSANYKFTGTQIIVR